MPTATQTFVNNPRQFLANNLVIMKGDGGGQYGPMPFRLELSATSVCKRPNGTGVPVFFIVLAQGNADSFRAYWLPYMNDNAYSLRLGNRADFLLTPTMDGCTFVVGQSTTHPGRTKVAHLNYQKSVADPSMPGTTKRVINQRKINYKIQHLFQGNTHYILKKGDYKLDTDYRGGEGVQLLTMGLRDANGNWDFVYQKRQIAAVPTSWEDFEYGSVTDAQNW